MKRIIHTKESTAKVTSLSTFQNVVFKIQYVRKSKTFNIINRTKDIKNLRTILVFKHFKKHNYDPNNHRKIILKDQLKEIATTGNETLKERLKKTTRKLLHNKTQDFSTT